MRPLSVCFFSILLLFSVYKAQLLLCMRSDTCHFYITDALIIRVTYLLTTMSLINKRIHN